MVVRHRQVCRRFTLIFTPVVRAPRFVNSKRCGLNVVQPAYVGKQSYDRLWIDRLVCNWGPASVSANESDPRPICRTRRLIRGPPSSSIRSFTVVVQRRSLLSVLWNANVLWWKLSLLLLCLEHKHKYLPRRKLILYSVVVCCRCWHNSLGYVLISVWFAVMSLGFNPGWKNSWPQTNTVRVMIWPWLAILTTLQSWNSVRDVELWSYDVKCRWTCGASVCNFRLKM